MSLNKGKEGCNRLWGNNRGFTLVELLLVIAILGILAGVAVPLFLGERTKAARTEATSNLQALRLLEEQYFAENACYYRSSGSCANATITGIPSIQDFLPGFKPGNEASLNFSYQLVISGNPSASAFTAIATGKAGTVVSGRKFCLNQDNDTQCP